MALQLTQRLNYDRIMNAVAAGTSDQTTSIVDMQGYESAVFLVSFGTITTGAITSIKVQMGDASGGSDMADYAVPVAVADSDDNKIIVIEVVKPMCRYLQVVIDRGTQNAVIDGVSVHKYNGRTSNGSQGANVASTAVFFTPAATY